MLLDLQIAIFIRQNEGKSMSKLYVYFSPKSYDKDSYSLYVCKESHKAGKVIPRMEVHQTILDVTGSCISKRIKSCSSSDEA